MRALWTVVALGCGYPEFHFGADAAPLSETIAPDTTEVDTAIGDEIDSGSVDATNDAPDTTTDVVDACACPAGQACGDTGCTVLASCAAIKAAFPSLPSGAYSIDPDGSGPLTPFRVFCEQVADGGGWTLAVKLDGRRATFAYGSPLWTNDTLLNPTSTDNSTSEAKFRSFLEVPFKSIRVRMFDGTTARFFPLDVAASSMKALFSGSSVTTSAGRAKWLALINDSALQANCNAEGVNREVGKVHLRIGIIANNETHCDSPDSFLGFGVTMEPNSCFPDAGPGIVVGNAAAVACGATKDKTVATFGFLYVR